MFGHRLWSDIRVSEEDLGVSATLSPWQVIQPDGESTEDSNDVSGGTSRYGLDNEDDDEVEESTEEKATLKPGRNVKLHSLLKKPELNGQLGICKRWVDDAGRWEVDLTKEFRLVMLQPSNLVVCDVSTELELEEDTCDKVGEEDEEVSEEVIVVREEDVFRDQAVKHSEEEDDIEQVQEHERSEVVASDEMPQELQQDLSDWRKELSVLQEMGFDDHSQLLPLLKSHIAVPAYLREQDQDQHRHRMEEQGQQEDGLQAVVWALLSGP
jgi:hypothetical protein